MLAEWQLLLAFGKIPLTLPFRHQVRAMLPGVAEIGWKGDIVKTLFNSIFPLLIHRPVISGN